MSGRSQAKLGSRSAATMPQKRHTSIQNSSRSRTDQSYSASKVAIDAMRSADPANLLDESSEVRARNAVRRRGPDRISH